MSELKEFLARSCARGRDGVDVVSPRSDVTVVLYFYWKAEDAPSRWPEFEGAILETWRNCGLLKTVVVSNAQHACVGEFACRFKNVKVQIEESLVPGSLRAMSIDCDLRLYSRFDTDYVLIVQNDGFPLRKGLDEFVGRYDYIGAPWVAHATCFDLYPYPKFSVGNGGFSLRSRRLCKTASAYYKKWFSKLPFWWYLLGDDTFYCKTLRYWFPSIRKEFKWASPTEASQFSVECNTDFLGKDDLPFGFHAEIGFRNAFLRIGSHNS